MKYSDLFKKYLAIKKSTGAVFYDSHVHPFEVFGLKKEGKEIELPVNSSTFSPTLLEKLKFNDVSLLILQGLFRFFPKYIRGEIRKSYRPSGDKILQTLLSNAGIDKATLVPIYPEASPHDIYKVFTDKTAIRLGSVNFSLSETELIRDLENQLSTYKIRGIKLHSNIQSFYPNPSENEELLALKLRATYNYAEKNGLYLLFHGGRSFIPENSIFQKKEFALPKHFITALKESLNTIRVPIIIAHLGVYNIPSPHIDDLRPLIEHDNVYFDTAGVNPKHAVNFLKLYGSKRLIFGSDAQYFNCKHAVVLLLGALNKFNPSDFEENVLNVFSTTYEHLILKTS